MPPPKNGSNASDSTTMPIPPNHCVTQRQSCNPCGNASMSVSMVAPVVVKPDMVSKNASMGDEMQPDSQNGSIPNSENTTQTTATTL